MNGMKYFAVVGHPIQHSFSPKIHTRFAQQASISLSYDAIDVPVDNFTQAVHQFFEAGDGLNVSLPFKKEAFKIADHVSERANCAEAVNTLWKDHEGQLHGDNTDGVGLVTDLLSNLKLPLADSHILIIGAGGAVQGILKPLVNQKPAQIVLCNRTHEKAEVLAQRFASTGRVLAQTFASVKQPFDLIINGTSAGIEGNLPAISPDVIDKQTFVYDMVYGEGAKHFLGWAKSNGAQKVSDGLGMLVEQAAEAFFIWHKVRPKTQDVLRYLREKI